MLSHNHYDHLDKAVIDFCHSQKTGFIVPLGVGVLLQKWGIGAERIQELDWWQSTQIGSITLSAVPAFHNTGRGMFDRNKTLWVGYVFQTSTEQIYYSGDSAFGDGSHFSQIAERFGRFDLAFIENGQYNLAWIDNHLLPEQTIEVVKRIAPARFMPIHWGAYGLSIHSWDEPVKRTLALLEQWQHPMLKQSQPSISPLTPMLGEVFNCQTQTQQWWQNIS